MSSVSHVWTCETWNYVEYPSPLVYFKFYSGDISLIMVWQIKSFNFKQGRMIPYAVGQLILSGRVKISVSASYIESGLQLEKVWYDYLVEVT